MEETRKPRREKKSREKKIVLWQAEDSDCQLKWDWNLFDPEHHLVVFSTSIGTSYMTSVKDLLSACSLTRIKTLKDTPLMKELEIAFLRAICWHLEDPLARVFACYTHLHIVRSI